MSDVKTHASDQQEIPESQLVALRRQHLQALRASGQAYVNQFKPKNLTQDLQDTYAEHDKQRLETLEVLVSVAGRVIRNRGAFIVIQDMTGQIQLYVDRK
jgi:lysyl-tRNA synthetase class 2